jgi:hypothetical protein
MDRACLDAGRDRPVAEPDGPLGVTAGVTDDEQPYPHKGGSRVRSVVSLI